MKNKIEDLRDHLFATLEELRDKEKPMDIARAKAIAGVAQVMINAAKVEVEFVRATGGHAVSQFFPEPKQPTLGTPQQPRLVRRD